MNVEENIELIARVYGIEKDKIGEKVNQVIEEFDLGEYRKVLAKKLSGGWQRRLSIAMALVSEPKYFFWKNQHLD